MSDNYETDPQQHRPLHLEDPWSCYEDEAAACSAAEADDEMEMDEDDCGCCCCCD